MTFPKYLAISLMLVATLLLITRIESKKAVTAAKGSGPKSRHAISSDDFKKGARIGFACQRVQAPLFRSPRRRPSIVFESVTIIKKTKITVAGEIEFNLICTRDSSTDEGETVSEDEAVSEAEAEGATEGTEADNSGEAGTEDGGADVNTAPAGDESIPTEGSEPDAATAPSDDVTPGEGAGDQSTEGGDSSAEGGDAEANTRSKGKGKGKGQAHQRSKNTKNKPK